MKVKLLILLICSVSFSANAQEDNKLISYYESTTDFVSNRPSTDKAVPKKIIVQTDRLSADGEKIKIFIADTRNLELNRTRGYKNAAWKTLVKKNLNNILDLNLTKEEIDELSIDQIKEMIINRNNAG